MGRSRPAPQPAPARAAILMATIESLPQPYEVLGLVYAAQAATAGIVPTGQILDRLADEAVAMGADAVIGIRLSQLTLPVASRSRLLSRAVEHYQNTVVAVALGTAVRRWPTHGTQVSNGNRRLCTSRLAR
jgi:hypothetical protein